jgi:hypothetical protein
MALLALGFIVFILFKFLKKFVAGSLSKPPKTSTGKSNAT